VQFDDSCQELYKTCVKLPSEFTLLNYIPYVMHMLQQECNLMPNYQYICIQSRNHIWQCGNPEYQLHSLELEQASPIFTDCKNMNSCGYWLSQVYEYKRTRLSCIRTVNFICWETDCNPLTAKSSVDYTRTVSDMYNIWTQDKRQRVLKT